MSLQNVTSASTLNALYNSFIAYNNNGQGDIAINSSLINTFLLTQNSSNRAIAGSSVTYYQQSEESYNIMTSSIYNWLNTLNPSTSNPFVATIVVADSTGRVVFDSTAGESANTYENYLSNSVNPTNQNTCTYVIGATLSNSGTFYQSTWSGGEENIFVSNLAVRQGFSPENPLGTVIITSLTLV